MNSKSLVVFVGIFVIQTISSCCNCDEAFNYNVQYNSLTISPVNISDGLINSEVIDTAFRDSFGLEVLINSELLLAANSSEIFRSFGFSSANACSCPKDEFQVLDPVTSVDIYVTDVKNSIESKVNSLFNVITSDIEGAQSASLEDFFDIRNALMSEFFQVQLVEFNTLPDVVFFRVDVFLESGRKFSEVTDEVLFIN